MSFKTLLQNVPPNLEAWQERALREALELIERLEKLDAFISGSVYESLPPAEQVRLEWQLSAMTSYTQALCSRIAAWSFA